MDQVQVQKHVHAICDLLQHLNIPQAYVAERSHTHPPTTPIKESPHVPETSKQHERLVAHHAQVSDVDLTHTQVVI